MSPPEIYRHLRIFSPVSYFIFNFFCCIIGFNLIKPTVSTVCEKARRDCALRTGCGFSLQNYMIECTDLIAGRTQICDPRCERALIGLVSSDEGKELINCDCGGNKYCELSKSRVKICRKSVYMAIREDTIVSCSTARWICISDQPCRTALEYYELNCHALFQGHKCTYRCNNSLSILDRQEKAFKLRTCYCDGTENFPCHRVKYFTERICYGRHTNHYDALPFDNSIEPIGRTNINNQENRKNYPRYRISSMMNRFRSNEFPNLHKPLPLWIMTISILLIFFIFR